MINADAMRELLIAWCDQNSGSENLAGLDRMLALLEAEFGKFPGAALHRVDLPGTTARALRLVMRPEAPRQILCSGHFDTVYSADHPFQTCTSLDADTLRGPGVADMKGGLVVMLHALRAFEASPGKAALGWEILLTPDEEIGSPSSAALLAAAAPRFDFALVFEPARTNGDLVKSRKGTGIFTATMHGRAAHAGRDPAAGRNAILALSEFLPRAHALNSELPGIMLNVGSIRGGGAVNIVPDFAAAEINLRVTTQADVATVLARLNEIATPWQDRDGFRFELTGRFNRPPKEASPAEEQIFAAWQECGREVGAQFSWQHVGGGSDGNLLAGAGLPNLDGLGVVGDGLHSPRECVTLSSLPQRAAIAARFLARAARGDWPLPARAHRA